MSSFGKRCRDEVLDNYKYDPPKFPVIEIKNPYYSKDIVEEISSETDKTALITREDYVKRTKGEVDYLKKVMEKIQKKIDNHEIGLKNEESEIERIKNRSAKK